MSITAGLVGLPNVGKSTLFNALTNSQAPAENYPFCTIEPHEALTTVPDKRLEQLAQLYGSKKIIPATVHFTDIAGLVKGAASGEGLGNQFLSHIREVDLILHVLRCFEDPNITHHGDTIDPLSDYEIIISELMLKDLESIEKREAKLEKLFRAAAGNSQEQAQVTAEKKLLESIKKAIDDTNSQKVYDLITRALVKTIPLLSAKKYVIIANVSEADAESENYKKNAHVQSLIDHFGQDKVIPVSAKLEYELSQLEKEDQDAMLSMLEMNQPGLERIITQTYNNLGLVTFFTCGPKEAHAWPILQASTVRKAAGEIHSDLERGFICAEVFHCSDLFALDSPTKLKQAGKMRTEGQEYIVHDGDVINIRFNV